jgi:hypothetical protein
MAYERLQAIVGTAIVDTSFRQSLLHKNCDVLGEFGLTEEESEAVSSIHAETIEGFASELHRWISDRTQMPRMVPAMSGMN